MKMTELQMRLIKENLKVLTSKDCFYKEKFKDIDVEAIQTQEDFEKASIYMEGRSAGSVSIGTPGSAG